MANLCRFEVSSPEEIKNRSKEAFNTLSIPKNVSHLLFLTTVFSLVDLKGVEFNKFMVKVI